MIEKMMTKKKTMRTEVNNANIVLYGFDNSGKTTLCKKLTREIFIRVPSALVYNIHSPGPLPLEGQIKWIEENLTERKGGGALDAYNNVTIFDRFPVIEEYVYGTVLRKNNNFKYLRSYCNEVLSIPLLFIYCRPPEEKITKWGNREQFEGVKENATQCLWHYDRMLEEYPIMLKNTIFYDFTEGDQEVVDHTVNVINQFFKMKKKINEKRRLT